MRDRRKGRIFGRETGQRRAFLQSLANNIILRTKITTTEARAKELRTFAEPLITTAKAGTLSARRALGATLSKEAATKLFAEREKFAKRTGGYLRITKLERRISDGSPMATVELLHDND